MDKQKITAAFNEWMRRYTDEPERFAAEFCTVGEFLEQDAKGEEPTYGATCVAYLEEIIKDLDGKGATEDGTSGT